MSQTFNGGFITVTATGVNITTGAASASTTIPNDSAGNIPRYIRVCCSVAAFVRLGKTTATAVTTDLMLIPGEAVILSTNGNDKVAALQVAAAGVVQVSPLENC